MEKLQAVTVQSLTLQGHLHGGIVQPVEIVFVIHGVEGISDDGVAYGRHVNAQLVGPAGFRC